MAKKAAVEETPVPAGHGPSPEEAPPAPSEIAEETVKLGRKKVSAQTADRAARFEGRQKLHDAYGTTSGRQGDRAS